MGVHDAEPSRPPAALMASTIVLAGRVSRLAADLLTGALAPLGLRGRHYSILMALAESGPASQQHLGRSLSIDRTTMVSIVDDLERLGLVTRATDPDDRRAYRVELTGRGRTSLVRAAGAAARAERTLLGGLSDDEQVQLHALLRRVVAHHAGDDASNGAGAVAGKAAGKTVRRAVGQDATEDVPPPPAGPVSIEAGAQRPAGAQVHADSPSEPSVPASRPVSRPEHH